MSRIHPTRAPRHLLTNAFKSPVVLLHAIVAVIHAVLQSAADALIAGFSLLIIVLVILAIIVGLIVTLTGCLGFGSIRWFRRRHNGKDDCD